MLKLPSSDDGELDAVVVHGATARPRREFRTEERKLLSFLSAKELKLRRNFREIQNLEGPEKPGSERHLAPESPETLKIASNSTIFNEITPKTW